MGRKPDKTTYQTTALLRSVTVLLESQVVLAALNQPRTTVRKAGLDIVTATDKESEAAVVAVISAAFPGHAILGEEGGVTGPVSSDYLWCVGPWYFQAVWASILNVNIF